VKPTSYLYVKCMAVKFYFYRALGYQKPVR